MLKRVFSYLLVPSAAKIRIFYRFGMKILLRKENVFIISSALRYEVAGKRLYHIVFLLQLFSATNQYVMILVVCFRWRF